MKKVRLLAASAVTTLLCLVAIPSAVAGGRGGNDIYAPGAKKPGTAAVEAISPKTAADAAAFRNLIEARVKASGGKIYSYQATQYTAVPASKGGATPMAFPSGCGLYVYVYKWNNASVGSSLTSCTYAVNYIQHDSNLYRLDWWGWDRRAQGERWTYNASSLALDISDYCSDQNNNSWKNVTWGKLTSGSTNYTATVYDEVYYACGGS